MFEFFQTGFAFHPDGDISEMPVCVDRASA